MFINEMRSYTCICTWVKKRQHHTFGKSDLWAEGHPCTGPDLLHTMMGQIPSLRARPARHRRHFEAIFTRTFNGCALLCHVHMGGKDAAPQDRERRSQDQKASMPWSHPASHAYVIDSVTARTTSKAQRTL